MELKKLLDKYIEINSNINITGIECDSRKVKEGYLFLAYPGEESDGRKYIEQAEENGAVAVLAERADSEINTDSIPLFFVNDLKKKVGRIAAEFYTVNGRKSSLRCPSDNIQIIGVTGTNGKTSTCFYIAGILNGMGIKTAVIGTTGYGIPGELTELNNTTPGPLELQKIFSELRDLSVKAVAMEVSSHALSQGRVLGIKIDAAVFTNLSQDHLDYHKDMEDYANAKKILFDMESVKYISLNLDDKYGYKWYKNYLNKKKLLTAYSTNAPRMIIPQEVHADGVLKINNRSNLRHGFGRQAAATHSSLNVDNKGINYDLAGYKDILCADNIKLDMKGLAFAISYLDNVELIKTALLGHFNVSNILAAVSVLVLMGYDFNQIVEQCKKLKAVPGRMQVCRSNSPDHPIAVVDYSHTPDALENALSALKKQCKGLLVCVFGCGGNRDRKKRPLMAQAVERYSDVIVVTNDNPRYEDHNLIIDDIKKGFHSLNLDDKGVNCDFAECVIIEPDRKKAIELAIHKSSSDDIVLIAGKGHEDYQIINGVKHHFSDVETVKAIFMNMEHKHLAC